MNIKDPNEIVARLYPTSTVAAGAGMPLTIRQPDGTNAVYDGSNAVTADARPKTLTVKQPDGTDVAYNGSTAVSVDTRPAVLEIKKPDGSSTYYDGSSAVTVNTQGKTLTVNNSDGTTTTFNGSANKTVTIPSTLPPTPGTVSFADLNAADKLRWNVVAAVASYVGEFTDNVVNVKFAGAKGDGVTDDAAALNDAFQSVQGSGGIVYFPPGVYVVRSYVEFFSNCCIIGVPGASILTYDSADQDTGNTSHSPQSLLRNHTESTQGVYTATENVVIDGLTFDGGVFPKKSTALGIGHSKNITVRNCTFKNGYSRFSSSHYIELNASQHCKVQNCVFLPEKHLAKDRDQAGAASNEQQRVYGEHINIDIARSGAYGSASYYKYDGTYCDDIEISNCYFESFPSNQFVGESEQWYISYAIGGHYYDGGHDWVENNINVHIFNNYFYGDWNAARRTGSSDSIPNRRFTITDSYMTGGSDGWVIHNNTFRAINTAADDDISNRLPVGIEINSNQTHNMIYSNTFINYGTLLYNGTVTNQHYWDNVNIKTDGTVVVANNLTP